MKEVFDPIQYKISTKTNWNKVAPEYHYNWADKQVGPFRSTKEVVRVADIKPDDGVLDIACGTGVVSKEISQFLGKDGLLIGIDISRIALGISRRTIYSNVIDFFEMDVENIGFNFKFDKVICQYGLMFFPNVGKVLESLREILRTQGRIVIAVHGLPESVPYFSTIMEPILKYIPNIRPDGTPSVHRFGNPEDLKSELLTAGFSDVNITRHEFTYEPGTFEEYWEDYMKTTANSLRTKIESHGVTIMNKIKKESLDTALHYEKDGHIIFPWSVLVATGLNKE
jgi:ubiquinone/menaquinone biosynthesis C-methylase UbiE